MIIRNYAHIVNVASPKLNGSKVIENGDPIAASLTCLENWSLKVKQFDAVQNLKSLTIASSSIFESKLFILFRDITVQSWVAFIVIIESTNNNFILLVILKTFHKNI